MTVPLGAAIISTRDLAFPWNDMVPIVRQSGIRCLKFHIGPEFSTDPTDVEQFIRNTGVDRIVLRTSDGLRGYQYEAIQEDFEGIRSGGMSFAHLVNTYRGIEWTLEIGNEPDRSPDFRDAWSCRWWALAAYKELALNYLGHIDRPWKDKYPLLQWCVSLPTNYEWAVTMVQWMNYHGGNDVGDGGVLDYYTRAGCHLYDDTQLGPNTRWQWWNIYQHMVGLPYCREILITELGINDPHIPDLEKARRYRALMPTLSPKVKAAYVWVLGKSGEFPQYDFQSVEMARILAS